MSDLIVTWPKTRGFGSYVAECAHATLNDQHIAYRVRRLPDEGRLGSVGDRRLYRVHDGVVKGYTNIAALDFREEGEVARVKSDAFAGFWPAGWYIVCLPIFYGCHPLSMPGFRGYRYFERRLVA